MRDQYSEPATPSSEILTVLRRRLADARGRDEQFAAVWPVAVRDVLAGLAPTLRREWRDALNRTRSTWQRCYDRDPATPAELALVCAVEHVDREPLPQRPCENCGGAVAPGRKAGVKYCSRECAVAATEVVSIDGRGASRGALQVPDVPVVVEQDWSDGQLEIAA